MNLKYFSHTLTITLKLVAPVLNKLLNRTAIHQWQWSRDEGMF